MKTVSTIFSKDQLKVSKELKDQIVQRFNDYDTLIKVMSNVSNNLRTLALTTTGMNYQDKQDIHEFSKLLKSATNTQWLKENNLYF